MMQKLVSKSLQRYWRLTRGLTMGAQGMIFDNDGKVLLIRHTYRPGWHFPGGGVEKNETAETTVRRELEEEAGIICKSQPALFGLYANFRSFPSDHIALYTCSVWEQPRVPEPNREIAEQGFFPRDALPDNTIAAVRLRLEEHAGERSPSTDWS
ncbi:MAG: NUDIX domain-containing protein [Pseudomonadota bacterium]